MTLQSIKAGLLNLKDGIQGLMYALLSYSRLYAAMASPLAFFLRPLLSLTLISLALIQLWTFIHSPHHNIDGWMISVGSFTSALLNNVASFGGVIMRLQGSSFLLAPWLLVAGFGLSSLYRFVLMGLNFYRAFEVPAHSVQRQHFLQLAFSNLVTALQLACCSSAIILFNLVPGYTFAIAAVALSVVAINLSTAVWRALAPQSRAQTKRLLGLSKPQEESDINVSHSKSHECNLERAFYKRLFTTADHSAFIKKMGVQESLDYLLSTINHKILILEPYSSLEKQRQKKEVMHYLQKGLLDHEVVVDKKQLQQQYAHLVDNFWCETSDTVQLIKAVEYYKKHSSYLISQIESKNGKFSL